MISVTALPVCSPASHDWTTSSVVRSINAAPYQDPANKLFPSTLTSFIQFDGRPSSSSQHSSSEYVVIENLQIPALVAAYNTLFALSKSKN